MADPLWLQLRNHPSLFCLHMTPAQAAVLLEELADRIEYRGSIDYDRDPGETSDWLRAEAAVAKGHEAERVQLEADKFYRLYQRLSKAGKYDAKVAKVLSTPAPWDDDCDKTSTSADQ